MDSTFLNNCRRVVVAVTASICAAVAGVALLGGAPAAAVTASVEAIDSAASSDPGEPVALRHAVRIAARPVVASEGPVPRGGGDSCLNHVARPALTLEIPSIGLSCPVFTGGQATMDAGGVTWVTAPGADSLLASAPGARGTLWIAAHRSTHGAPFASVPDLADGAIVTVSDATATASYRVVARVLVQVRGDVVLDAAGTPTNAATLAAITRSDGGGDRAPRLLLQTCEGSTMRWMIYADLVAAS